MYPSADDARLRRLRPGPRARARGARPRARAGRARPPRRRQAAVSAARAPDAARRAGSAGRRLRALPRPDRPDRGAGGPRAARRHGPRPGRRERRRDPGRPRRDAARRPARRDRDRRLGATCAGAWRSGARRPAARRRSSTAASISSASAPLARADGPAPAFLCVGSLTERKNVVRLARAFERLGEGTLTFVGDGPLRAAARGTAGRRAHGAGRRTTGSPATRRPRTSLCQPSLVEPFGQSALEALACGRPVVATPRRRAARSSCRAEAGVLVDPLDEDALAGALRAAAALPVPNEAARAAAELHDVRRQARGSRRFSSEPLEVGEPDLHERPHGVLETRLARDRERLLVALARLLGRDALLQPVVAGDEKLLDPGPCVLLGVSSSGGCTAGA